MGYAGSVITPFYDSLLVKLTASGQTFEIALRRMDRALRRLESLLIVADKASSLMLSGSGDVIEPSDGVVRLTHELRIEADEAFAQQLGEMISEDIPDSMERRICPHRSTS